MLDNTRKLEKESLEIQNISGLSAKQKVSRVDNDVLSTIKEQVGSDGRKGWPVAVRDRISYPQAKEDKVTQANCAITFLWTMRDAIIPKLEKQNLAIATNFYTPSGLAGMVRNILANPYIRYMILLGEEYSSKSKDDQISELTSANAIRAFFEKGINPEGKIEGFESAIYFDKHIPKEMINLMREKVRLIDLNKEMPGASFEEKIIEANKLMNTLEKKAPFIEKPYTFAYEESKESCPYEGGAIVVHEKTIPKTWIDIMHQIYRYGIPSLMDANTDRWIKEVNPIVAVIHDPQNMDLSLNPFLVPITKEKIEAYKAEILSPILPPGKAYTYGNKLRAYSYPDQEGIKKLVNSTEFKDFEFGQGTHLDVNVNYGEKGCEIDQIQDIIDALKRNNNGKWGIGITWHVADELMRKHKSSPCLVFIQALVQEGKLNLVVYFRSHDMAQGWPENAYGCAAIQKKIAEGIGLPTGILTIISSSAHIYSHYYKQVETMLGKYRELDLSYKAPRGNWVIEVKDRQINCTLIHPENGKEITRYTGTKAQELRRQICKDNYFEDSYHPMYIGAELMRAETCLKSGMLYEQDKGLE